MLLTETVVAKPQFVESDRSKLPETVLCRVTYPICNIDQLNANGRIYEKSVWEKVLNDSVITEKIANRNLFGHAEHPVETQSDLRETSHIITEMWLDESDGRVYQTVDVVDTPTGRIVDCLLRADSKVGMSTRAEGDLEEAEDDSGNRYQRVIPESYHYVTTDFTADPSTFGATPLNVRHNVAKTVQKELESKKLKDGDREFARAILESIQETLDEAKADEAKVDEVKVEITVDDTSKVTAEDAQAVVVDGMGDVHVSTPQPEPELPVVEEPMVEPVEEPVEEPAEDQLEEPIDEPEKDVEDSGEEDEVEESKVNEVAPEQLHDAVEEYIRNNPDSTMKNLHKKFGKDVDDVVARLENLNRIGEDDGKYNIKEDIVDTTMRESVMNDIVKWKIREAEVRAERDKVMEEIQKLSSNKSRDVVVKNYKKVREHLLGRIDSLKKDVSGLRTVLETKALNEKESKTKYNESITKATEIEERLKLVESEHQEDLVDQCSNSVFEGKQIILREYFDRRLQESNLGVHDNVRALLEQCCSLSDVDDLVSGIIQKGRRNALHSEQISEITVRKPARAKKDKVQEAGDDLMGEMFEAFGYKR